MTTQFVSTVNVMEINDIANMSVGKLVSFNDSEQGNKDAETLFKKIVNENSDLRDMEIENCIEDGFYENGNYWVGIVHSNFDKVN